MLLTLFAEKALWHSLMAYVSFKETSGHNSSSIFRSLTERLEHNSQPQALLFLLENRDPYSHIYISDKAKDISRKFRAQIL